MSDQDRNELIGLLQNAGLHANNVTIETALRFVEREGWQITKPAAK